MSEPLKEQASQEKPRRRVLAVKARIQCPVCENGRIRVTSKAGDRVKKLYDTAYCPCCGGNGFTEAPATPKELASHLQPLLQGKNIHL